MESKALIRVKSHVKSKLKSTILSQCSHHLIVGHNKNQSSLNENEEFNVQSISEMFQKFPYDSDIPKPLLPPSKIQRDCCGKEDLSMQLIYTKAKIQDDINRYLELYKKHSRTLDKHSKKNAEWEKENGRNHTTLPKYLAATAEILECDPDPNFSGTYNWYYSGGTLNGILYDTRNILIFPYAKELVVLPVDLTQDSPPDYKNASKITINENLFQIVCSTSNNNGRILTRHKNNCFVYSLFNMNKKKLRLLQVDSQSSDIPYTSADLDPLNANRYCTTNVDRNIAIWDINKPKHILSGHVPVIRHFEDSWAFIKYDTDDCNILKYIDRHCVHYYDTRLPIERSVLTMCPKDNLEDCESLSSYVASCTSEYFSYVGSNHSLCLLDSRSANVAVVKKWTHQFKNSPLFIDSCCRENKEFVVIASQLSGETAIILNYWNSSEESPESCCTPFTPPSVIETLIASQSQGQCLSPQLKNRLLLCNTGCMTTVDKENGDIFLLTQNSVNDIFYQSIGHQEPLDLYSLENCKSLYKLKKWERQIMKNSHHDIISPLVVTKRTNACDVFRNFTNQKLQSNTVDDKNNPLEYVPRWKRTVAELNLFVDIFAPELLAPWEVLEETPLIPISAAPHQKVLSWLGIDERNQEEVNNDSQQTAVVETKEIDIYQDPDIFLTHDSGSIQQLFLPKVKSESSQNVKKDKKRSKFVPGF